MHPCCTRCTQSAVLCSTVWPNTHALDMHAVQIQNPNPCVNPMNHHVNSVKAACLLLQKPACRHRWTAEPQINLMRPRGWVTGKGAHGEQTASPAAAVEASPKRKPGRPKRMSTGPEDVSPAPTPNSANKVRHCKIMSSTFAAFAYRLCPVHASFGACQLQCRAWFQSMQQLPVHACHNISVSICHMPGLHLKAIAPETVFLLLDCIVHMHSII